MTFRSRLLLPLLCVAVTCANAATPGISAGDSHSLAVKADGTVRAWGSDGSGQLGSGRQLVYLTPAAVPGLSEARAISAGCEYNLALRGDGTVWSWGANEGGQLGDGTTAGRSTPAPVAGLANVAKIFAGCSHALALKADGTVWAWGRNVEGQAGDGTRSDRAVAAQVAGLADVVAIAAGIYHSIALKRDGTVWQWGETRSPFGTSTLLSFETSPRQVAGVSDVAAVDCTQLDTIALRRDGSLMAWGQNFAGEIGDGTTTQRLVPVAVPLTGAVALVKGGGLHVLVARTDGSMAGWGDNRSGQIGDGSFVNRTSAVNVTGISAVTILAAGTFHSAAITNDGTLWTWGSNGSGQLGDGSSVSRSTPRRITLGGVITGVSAGSEHTIALKSDGTVWAWGSNRQGQLAVATATFAATPSSVNLPGAIAVSAGYTHSLALRADGSVMSWGANTYGQLGDGSSATSTAPLLVAGLSDVVAIAAGGSHSVALKRDGTVWTWGYNWAGQLGNGTTGSRSTPQAVVGLADVIAVSASSTATMALKRDGTVWSWGLNDQGQLGVTSTFDCNPSFRQLCSPQPTQVPAVNDAVAVAAGGNHGLIVRSDGTVWGFGQGNQGQLGELANPSATLRRVAGLSDVAAVSAADYHTIALKRDGTVWTLGDGREGHLGNGTLPQSQGTPVQAIGLAGITAISANSHHVLAVKSDGTVWSWGANVYAQLGDGSIAWHAVPVVVRREGGVGSIAGKDWFLDANPAASKLIPAEKIPAYLVNAQGSAASSVAGVTASIQFRAQDVGKPIYVFAYAPTAIVKRGEKDAPTCVLSELAANGQLQAASASNLQNAVGSVVSTQAQAVAVLANIASAQLAGATFCVGTGAQATQAANSQCIVTVPAEQVCVGPSGASVAANIPGPLSGMWWNPAESGWGVHFTQRGSNVFAAWYTYDNSGLPKWYVASNCAMAASALSSGACGGPLYEVTGPSFFAGAFDPSVVRAVSAGTLQVNFASTTAATMTYAVAGQSRSVPLQRQVLQASGSVPPVDYTDLWWNSAESGWGIAITQQFGTIFLAWYVYDSAGRPVWLVVPNCPLDASQAGCSGDAYRTTGPSFAAAFNPTQVHASAAGTVRVTFTDANSGVLTYTIDGLSATKTIQRQIF